MSNYLDNGLPSQGELWLVIRPKGVDEEDRSKSGPGVKSAQLVDVLSEGQCVG